MVFISSTNLNFIEVYDENNYYSNDNNGILYDKDYTTIICYPMGITKSSFEIPNSVIIIGDRSFYQCSLLTNIVIQSLVTTIGSNAFQFCTNLNIIGKSVNLINSYAFANCDNLACIYYEGYVMPNVYSNAFNAISTYVMTSDAYQESTFGPLQVSKGSSINECLKYIWPTQTFTKSNIFTKSNVFSRSNPFTKSNVFSRSNTFTKSNVFSRSNPFTKSNVFSRSNPFTKSNVFSRSNPFTKSNVFSRSNTFTKSNVFTKFEAFTESKHFEVTFTQTLILTHSLVETIISKTILSNSITLTVFGSSYSFISSIFIYYEYTIIEYSSYIMY